MPIQIGDDTYFCDYADVRALKPSALTELVMDNPTLLIHIRAAHAVTLGMSDPVFDMTSITTIPALLTTIESLFAASFAYNALPNIKGYSECSKDFWKQAKDIAKDVIDGISEIALTRLPVLTLEADEEVARVFTGGDELKIGRAHV